MKLEVLRERDFAIYMSGNLASWTALWIQRLAIGWLSWDLSHSAAWVGLVSFAQFGPVIVFGPMFGVLADKLDRRIYAIRASAVQMAIAIVLFVVAAMGWMTIGILFALCLATGVTTAAYQPVRLAMVNDLVPRSFLTQAIAINSLVFNLTRFIGPALGGIVIATLGVAVPFAINAASYLALIVALHGIRLRPSARAPATGAFWADLRAGIAYVRQHAVLRHIIMLGLISNFIGRGVLELSPVFAEAIYGEGASGLATLTAATGLGSIVSAGLVTRAPNPSLLPRLGRRSLFASSSLLVALGLTRWFPLGVALCFALGFALTLTGVSLQVALQSTVQDDFRGRIVGLWGVVVTGGSAVGGAIIGAFSQLAGLLPMTVACGVAGVALAWSTRAPATAKG